MSETRETKAKGLTCHFCGGEPAATGQMLGALEPTCGGTSRAILYDNACSRARCGAASRLPGMLRDIHVEWLFDDQGAARVARLGRHLEGDELNSFLETARQIYAARDQAREIAEEARG